MNSSATVDLSKSILDLGTGSEGDHYMRNVGEQLGKSTIITSLTLNDQRITANGGTMLFDELKENQTLEELYLSRCGMHTSAQEGAKWPDGSPIQYDTSSMPALVDALKVNRTLKTLNIDGNVMSVECATQLAEALKVNGTLQSLSMCYCFLDADNAGCMRALAEALTVNRTLKKLILNENKDDGQGFSAEGLTHLAEALKVNQGLTRLELMLGNIGDEGALPFVEALKVNRTLTHLDFANNNIKSPETVQALRAAALVASTDRPKAVHVSLFGAYAPLAKRPA